MTPEQIETAIGAHLATMAGAPVIVRGNQNADPARPFIAFSHSPVMRNRLSLSGAGAVVERGFVALSIVTAWGTNGTAANGFAAAITARFPKGLRLAAGSGLITITDDARIAGPGYHDMQDWRLPMQIDYRAIA
jgi:hypothetical protein